MNARTQLWDRVYATSMDQYTEIKGFGDYDARLTADIAADNWYQSNFLGGSPRKRVFHGLSRLPDPGDFLRIGAALGCEWVMSNGAIRGCEWHASCSMLWSDRLQAVLVLPDARMGACSHPPTPREAKLLAIWARGRAARCSRETTSPMPAMPVVNPCVTVSYRSDKFSPGKPRNYIHHIDSRGVLAYFSSQPFGATRAPTATMIRGGRLRLTPHGLAG